MNKALLKKMVGEVSVSTLAALLTEYAQSITEADEVDEEAAAAIETVAAELKGRAKPDRTPRKPRKKPEEVASVANGNGGDNVGQLRKEADMLQR